MRVRLIDLDGSLRLQLPLVAAVEEGWGQLVDLTELAEALRLWARPSTMARAAALLRQAGEPPGRGPVLNFLGSGDFHHLAAVLIGQLGEPVTVVHFDNHPDWVRFAPDYHCGSWVNRVLAMDHVQRVITIGPCSDDLTRPQLKGGNLRALAGGRLELYPWRHAPSRVWGRIDPGPSAIRRGKTIVWRNVGDDFNTFLGDLAGRLANEPVWLSIDKDVLRYADVLTNWDQGEMPLSALIEAVRLLGRNVRIVGGDVCGDFSPPRHRQWTKRWEAWTDQPRRAGIDDADLARNARANGALLSALHEVMQ